MYGLYDLYDLAHVAAWQWYNLHALAHVSWVGSISTVQIPQKPLTKAGGEVDYLL